MVLGIRLRPLPPLADGFDFPVGAPDALGYYDAQPFGTDRHLGNDWNGPDGGDSDLNDPVYAVAAGVVRFARDVGGGWGNVVRIEHRVRGVEGERPVESLYAHLERVDVQVDQPVARGQIIGSIGTAHGRYKAHLHFELRPRVGMGLGGGYGEPLGNYLDATAFIQAHRPEAGAFPVQRLEPEQVPGTAEAR